MNQHERIALSLPGGPAFPVTVPEDNPYVIPGMSLRDWFAGKAMAARLPGGAAYESDFDAVARNAYQMADAMLKERSK